MTLSLLLLTQEAEHAAQGALPAPFSPTPGLFIWTLVVFFALLILLAKTVYPMILKATVEREAQVTRQLADAERMHAESKAALEEQRQLLAGARGEAQAIIAEARTAADRERQLGIEKTRTEQDELLARARREIAAEKDRATADVRREVVDIAIAAAAKVIGQRLDAADDRKLVEDYLAGLGTRA